MLAPDDACCARPAGRGRRHGAVHSLRPAATGCRHARAGNKPTTVTVRTGPYRFSRNPIYLAMSVLHLGIAIWVNSVWLVATLAVAVALMAIVVVPREERYLEAQFGPDYPDCKASMRRWL